MLFKSNLGVEADFILLADEGSLLGFCELISIWPVSLTRGGITTLLQMQLGSPVGPTNAIGALEFVGRQFLKFVLAKVDKL